MNENNNGCASGDGTGWSIIASASANSQLAGVLAAVIFSGIVILFARRGARSSQALGLFAVTFVILAFDSYLFGTITGLTTDQFCNRVCSEGMTAAGLLGVGGFALMTGISWLMSDHVDATAEAAPVAREHKTLARLSKGMILGVATGVALLLCMTSLDYLNVMYKGKTPARLSQTTWATPIMVFLLSIVLPTGRRALQRVLRVAVTTPNPDPSFTVATFGLLAFGIVGPVSAGLMMGQPDSTWMANDQSVVILVSMAIGLWLPGLLIIAVVLATPEVGGASTRTGASPHEALVPDGGKSSSPAVQLAALLLVLAAVRRRRFRRHSPCDHDARASEQ